MEPALPKEESNDYSEYKDNPSDMFKIANGKLNKNQFEEGLAILEKAIQYALAKYGSEKDIHLCIFYTRYAEALIRKLLESDELLAIPDDGNEESKNQKSTPKVSTKPKEGKEPEEDDEDDDNGNGEEETDDQIILGNLLCANGIYLKYLTPYDIETDLSKLSPEIIGYYNELAFNYLMFGEYEKAKSDFPKAVDYYLKAIDIRIKYDKPYSRNLAELYFNLAFVYDSEPKQCLLSLFKAKTIMEFHLSVELAKHPNFTQKLIINKEDLNLEEIKEDDPKIFMNKKIVESDEVKVLKEKDEEIESLVFILDSLYIKLEDTALECTQYETYKKEKERLKNLHEQQTGTFTDNYDKSKVIDITNTVVRKKRPRSPTAEELLQEEDNKKVTKPPEPKK